MEEDKKKLSEVINQLALQIMMVGPDDVMTLGLILEKLEAIGEMSLRTALKSAQSLSESLKKVVEKIILNELPTPQEGVDLLEQGTKLLQSRISRSDSTSLSPEEESYLEKLGTLLGEVQTLSIPEKRQPAKAEPLQPASADLSQDMDLFPMV